MRITFDRPCTVETKKFETPKALCKLVFLGPLCLCVKEPYFVVNLVRVQ